MRQEITETKGEVEMNITEFMIESQAMARVTECTRVEKEFESIFGASVGDCVEFIRIMGDRQIPTVGRIIEVQDIYQNSAGGTTATVRVVPLLASGRIGNSRSVQFATKRGSRSLTGLGVGSPVRLIVQSKRYF